MASRIIDTRPEEARLFAEFTRLDRDEFERLYNVTITDGGRVHDNTYDRSFKSVKEWAAWTAIQEKDFNDFEVIPRGGKTFY
jgi:hypothetical protein